LERTRAAEEYLALVGEIAEERSLGATPALGRGSSYREVLS
jgi:hypothetical protein